MKAKETKLIGRLMAAEFVIGLLLDAVPQARQALAGINLDKLEGFALQFQTTDATNAGFLEAIELMQKRHQAQG